MKSYGYGRNKDDHGKRRNSRSSHSRSSHSRSRSGSNHH
jgi:hypothetical protein